jgi:hypothetical protein
MAIDYSTLLTDEQKRSILEQRLQQFAAEAWQHQINKQVADATGNTDGAADAALEILDAAIAVHQTELAALRMGLNELP